MCMSIYILENKKIVNEVTTPLGFKQLIGILPLSYPDDITSLEDKFNPMYQNYCLCYSDIERTLDLVGVKYSFDECGEDIYISKDEQN